MSKNRRFAVFSRLWGVFWRGKAFLDQQSQFVTRNKSLSSENESNCSMTSECVRTDSILPRGAGHEHGHCNQSIFSLSIFGILVERHGIPTTVRKTEVRTTPVRSQECECQQCEETTVRMRQKCEGQVCEGQECECDFSAIGQNSEVIQIERSRSFCLQDGVFLSLFLSQSLFFSLGLYVRVRIRVSQQIVKKQPVKVDPNNSPNRFSSWIWVRVRVWVGVFQLGYGKGRGYIRKKSGFDDPRTRAFAGKACHGTVSFSHCCHSHCCRTFFAPMSHRTAGIRTIDIRTLVASHC